MNLNGKLLRSACYSNTQFVNQIVTESAKRKKMDIKIATHVLLVKN